MARGIRDRDFTVKVPNAFTKLSNCKIRCKNVNLAAIDDPPPLLHHPLPPQRPSTTPQSSHFTCQPPTLTTIVRSRTFRLVPFALTYPTDVSHDAHALSPWGLAVHSLCSSTLFVHSRRPRARGGMGSSTHSACRRRVVVGRSEQEMAPRGAILLVDELDGDVLLLGAPLSPR